MSELPTPTNPVIAPSGAPAPAVEPHDGPEVGRLTRPMRRRLLALAWLAVAVLVAVSLLVAWRAQRRVTALEQELVLRLRATQDVSAEARKLAQLAQDGGREAASKLAALEARVNELSAQRNQIEALVGTVSRTRDENVAADVEAGLRIAMQQSAVSGSVEPLVLALRQSDERLARQAQPRLEPVRRAIARDLERVRAIGMVDTATLASKLDEAVRIIDELPLRPGVHEGVIDPQPARASAPRGQRGSPTPEPAPMPADSAWWPTWIDRDAWRVALHRTWLELRSLVRVTRIDHPEAVLMAPEQSFFLRANLKLRVLNARLALLSRQFETARADLQMAEDWLNRYFDEGSRRTRLASELLRQVGSQAHQGGLARPDDTLAALAAVR